METCRPGGWAGGRRPGSKVDTPKLSGVPSLCAAADGLSAGSTMVTDATVKGSQAAGTSVHVWRRKERTVLYIFLGVLALQFGSFYVLQAEYNNVQSVILVFLS